MTRETCATCRSWLPDGSDGLGYCRRQPPLSAAIGLPKWPRAIFDDWCGEHQPVAPAPVASDEYTRAAVRYAEVQFRLNETADYLNVEDRINVANEFRRLYRERHAPTEPEVAARVEGD